MNQGDIVVAWGGQVFFSYWKPRGVRGKVMLTDRDGGVCVELFVSHAFKPRFWFPKSELTLNPQPGLTPQTLSEFENTFVGGLKAIGTVSPIRLGLLHSWLVIKLRAMPGQAIYDLVLGMLDAEILAMINDTTGATFTRWANANDSRTRRALITDEELSVGPAPTIKRPRLV